MDLRVLWTIAGSMGTMSDIEMLKKSKLFHIDVITSDIADRDAASFIATGKKYILPQVKDPGYIDAILELCKNESITTVIPQYTDELVPMAQNLHRFEALGIKLLVTKDVEMLRVANSKTGLYHFFKERDFIPNYTLANDIASIRAAVKSLGYPDVPVCIKPVNGEGGKGFRIITEERVDLFNEAGGSMKITLEAYIDLLKGVEHIPELMVSEYLPGTEYSIDCVCKEGKTYICIPRQRIETSMGVASVSLIDKNDMLIEYAKEIISALKLSYNINLQFKYSRDSQPKLIEINPRVSGSLVANEGAGVNMLEQALKLAYELPMEEVKVKWGTKMIRYWSQIFTQV